ncbi:MAG: TonB-dependent receptor [Bacteroidota bacterium]
MKILHDRNFSNRFAVPVLTACLILMNNYLYAQNLVSGKVTTKEGEALIGVTILEQGTNYGVITDIDGNFNIKVKPDAVLVISYVGYVSKSIPVGNRTDFNIQLESDVKQLEEIVVVGYGTQKKSHLTGAISKLKNEKLNELPFTRADEILVGQIAGLQVSTSSEEGVGSDPTLRVRGVGSINADAGPLLVIDGAPVDSDFFGNLDINDIESYEVLKDAASAAIFGSRGANGVILITTKDGKDGPTKFNYNGFTGYQEAIRSDDYDLSVEDQIAFETSILGEVTDRTRFKQQIGSVDWQDVFFDGGLINSHSLSARGGNKKTKFSTSISYFEDEGVLLTDNFERVNFKAKVQSKVSDKFSFNLNLSPSYSVRRRFPDATREVFRQEPYVPTFHTEETLQLVDTDGFPDLEVGDFVRQSHFNNFILIDTVFNDAGEIIGIDSTDLGGVSNTNQVNPVARATQQEIIDKRFQIYSSLGADYKLNENLSFTASFTASFQDLLRTRFEGLEHSIDPSDALARETNQSRFRLVQNVFANYSKSFINHEITAVLGFSGEQVIERFTEFESRGFSTDAIPRIEGGASVALREGFERQRRLLSYIGRVNYAFQDKYLASLSVRADGSSSFGPNNRYGIFPAASIGWRISQENFLAGSSILSDLKLRASYGVTGNDAVNLPNNLLEFNAFQSVLESTSVASNGGIGQTFVAANIANPDLQWERSIEFNPGIDLGLFDNRIIASIEYYQRTSDDLLLNVPVSTTTGFDAALVNIGEVRNEGAEFEIRTVNVNSGSFSWNSTLIASTNKNTLRDFGDADGTVLSPDDGSRSGAEWLVSVGNPISNFYGFVAESEIPIEFIQRPFDFIGGQNEQVYVKDLNGDGIIDDDDRTILGNPLPDFIWSITNEFTYKNFDLSFQWQGSHGAETRNIADFDVFGWSGSDLEADPNTTPNFDFVRPKIQTDAIIQDASFIALRNLNFGYTLPQRFLDSFKLSSARIYASASNLLYLTASDFTGFNPESIRQGGDFNAITNGYNRGGVPLARRIVIGVNINF